MRWLQLTRFEVDFDLTSIRLEFDRAMTVRRPTSRRGLLYCEQNKIIGQRFIPGSKLTFSTNLFHHSLLAPIWTAFSDYTGPDFSAQRFFIFSYFLFFILFWVVR